MHLQVIWLLWNRNNSRQIGEGNENLRKDHYSGNFPIVLCFPIFLSINSEQPESWNGMVCANWKTLQDNPSLLGLKMEKGEIPKMGRVRNVVLVFLLFPSWLCPEPQSCSSNVSSSSGHINTSNLGEKKKKSSLWLRELRKGALVSWNIWRNFHYIFFLVFHSFAPEFDSVTGNEKH